MLQKLLGHQSYKITEGVTEGTGVTDYTHRYGTKSSNILSLTHKETLTVEPPLTDTFCKRTPPECGLDTKPRSRRFLLQNIT